MDLIHSSLSRTVEIDGIKLEVEIYRLPDTDWSLEVVNPSGTSTVWDDLFSDDNDAFAEFERTVSEEGMSVFLDEDQV